MSIKETIALHKLRASKKLGQHFLTDEALLERIVRAAHLRSGTHVIEIGPGPGGLTRALLADEHCTSVTAIELDPRCAALLTALQEDYPQLRIIECDALQQDMTSLSPVPRAIVANLPYNVGTQLVMQWLQQIHLQGNNAYDSITIMLQKEVIDRMAAQPSTKDYGRLSVICQWLCEVQPCFDVAPEYFSPPPKVMSAVVRLQPRTTPAFQADFTKLSAFLHAAFGQRRKMLRSALKGWHDNPSSILEGCDIDPSRRAETLTLQEIGAILAAVA